MKKRFLSILVLPTLALSACSLFAEQTYDTYGQELMVYDIDKLDDTKVLPSEGAFKINARFIEGQKYIPYVTLKQYASLYLSHIASDVSYEIKDNVWTIYKGKSACFIAEINNYYKEIYYAGSIQNAYKEDDDPRDLKALNYGLNYTPTINSIGNVPYSTISYGDYGIPRFKYENEFYYPLSFFDTAFIDASSIYFTYNYKHIISTRDVENYSTVTYIDSDKEYTFDSQMEEMSKEDTVIPTYLAKWNANLFLFMMDNFYGLKHMKKISSFSSYYRKNHGIYNALFSSDNETRGFAYSDALSVLDDNHTLLISANKSWGEDIAGKYRRYGEGCHNRSSLRTQLNSYRNIEYGMHHPQQDILYSKDEKTAMFSFDSFSFGTSEEVFNEDGTIKSTAGEHDTYFLLLDVLKEIKAKGSVENVILDVSINGGGVLGIMLKLLALISKDNSSMITMYVDTNGQAVSYTPKVDTNGDGNYDLDDVYGDDFNFYILTSDCSFSCGNAFPCAAQLHGDAKIIGQKSGGGECVVAVHYMPNSEYVYHSSNTHLGIWDSEKSTFKGFEGGATPDIEIPIDFGFHNIDILNAAIQNAQ